MPTTIGPSGTNLPEDPNARKNSIVVAFKGFFKHRSLRKASDTENKIPDQNKSYGIAKEKITKHSVVRAAGRANSLTKKERLVYSLPVQKVEIEPHSKSDKVSSYRVTDHQLAELNGSTSFATAIEPERPIFNESGPAPEDIRQADSRSTCHLLSALASYAASPTGKELLKGSIQVTESGEASVTFEADGIDQQAVSVSTDRLLSNNGEDIFSFSNKSEALWPGLIEKAFSGMRTKLRSDFQTRIKSMEDAGNYGEAANLIPLRDRYTSSTGSTAADHSELFSAIQFLPPFPKCKAPENLKQDFKSSVTFDKEDLTDPGQLELLKTNIELGVPVILGTHGKIKGGIQALKTGTPSNHAVAVLGPAEQRTKDGHHIKGVIIYDPYGESLGGDNSESKSRSNSLESSPEQPSQPTSSENVPTTLPDSSDSLLESYDLAEDVFDDIDIADYGFILPEEGQTPEIFDDFISVDKNEAVTDSYLKGSGRATRFCSYNDLHKYFRNAATAKGGLRSTS
ncbi:hypothetical protein EOPP23_08965 [Endozoicomonas sp. OPT23]|uniref:C2 family cysteine protease n=1 Tax=Endozoicomonas sp. OPT23 TaxID=2072845 RepID=UPI00129A6B49|nr:C2 family cysteine protease [Endozoicomonas sp. OPT23]MRI33112.1 hypothetical protein [Endozoicomonas sp. OPT23]